jgi:Protein of unknown function (DUF1264)
LIGIEYLISDELFQQLPPEERRLWSPNTSLVKDGQVALPDVPDLVENGLMKKLAKSYSKTWITWQADRGDELPLGLPIIAGPPPEVNAELLSKRDVEMKVDTQAKRDYRSSIGELDTVDSNAGFFLRQALHGKYWLKLVRTTNTNIDDTTA